MLAGGTRAGSPWRARWKEDESAYPPGTWGTSTSEYKAGHGHHYQRGSPAIPTVGAPPPRVPPSLAPGARKASKASAHRSGPLALPPADEGASGTKVPTCAMIRESNLAASITAIPRPATSRDTAALSTMIPTLATMPLTVWHVARKLPPFGCKTNLCYCQSLLIVLKPVSPTTLRYDKESCGEYEHCEWFSKLSVCREQCNHHGSAAP